MKPKKQYFSLIELLIVIAILGALVALILPSLESSEDDAKDTACDYNNYGTLRYVTMFESVNGVYPSGFHTGLEADIDNANTMAGLAGFTCANMIGNPDGFTLTATGDENEDNMWQAATTTAASAAGNIVNEALGANTLASLQKAGIMHLAYGNNTATAIDATSHVIKVGDAAQLLEDQVNTDGLITLADGSNITINGRSIPDYIAAGDVCVPLFVAPTIDWDHYYPEESITVGVRSSKIGIGLPGKCPHLKKEAFRYYICLFSVDNDGGTKAKLIGTLCPECGSLNP